MDFERALAILADSHTRDDDTAGFLVEGGGRRTAPWISHSDYIEAWKVVRQYLGRSVETVHERRYREAFKAGLTRSPIPR